MFAIQSSLDSTLNIVLTEFLPTVRDGAEAEIRLDAFIL